ncbi:MAG: CBS domain-containing protein [Desulfopila sp.]
MKTAADIMTREVITVSPSTSVKALARVLTEHNISGVPVVDEHGAVIGVVTESDLIYQNKKIHIPTVVSILDAVFYLERPDSVEKEIHKIAGSTVADIYNTEITTVALDTTVDELATIMSEQSVHTLPVLDEGKLVGIIGKKDIIRSIID